MEYIQITGIDDKKHITKMIRVFPTEFNFSNNHLFISSKSPKNINESSKLPKNINESLESSKNIHESSKSPKNINESLESPKNIHESSKSPKNIDESLESPKNIDESLESLSLNTENIICDTKNKFNDEQNKLVESVIQNIDSNSIIVVNGIAGSGKSFTILEMFDLISDKIKDRKLYFCAPTNSVITRNKKKYLKNLKNLFAKVEFLTVSTLLNEKLFYDYKGDSYFKIIEKKTNYIFNSDIIIIDEISMINPEHLEYIINNKNKFNLCILLGDKNQLDPPTSSELDIFNNIDINLTKNMRCNNSNIDNINKLMIKNIESYNSDFNYHDFIFELYNQLYVNNLNIFVQEFDFLEQFTINYLRNNSVIGNYTNKNCDSFNNKITNIIKSQNDITMIDNYHVNQRIIFKNKYENWNNSDFATIKSIKTKKYKFQEVKYSNLIQINKDLKHTFIITSDTKEYCNEYTQKNNKLFKSQQLFNYLLSITNFYEDINIIFKELNNFKDVKINLIKLDDQSFINVLNSEYISTYNTAINKIKNLINKLNKLKFKKLISIKTLFYKYFIEGLWNLLHKFRIDIFANIECAFACTIHKLQGCSIQHMFVNLVDIFKVSENKNKLKCLYTAFSRTIQDLYIYLEFNPLCNCNCITKLKYSDTEGIYYWICANKKCTFYESKIDTENCSYCKSCNTLYHNTFIRNHLCCKCYTN